MLVFGCRLLRCTGDGGANGGVCGGMLLQCKYALMAVLCHALMSAGSGVACLVMW